MESTIMKTKSNRFMLIAVALLVVTTIGIASIFYSTDTAVLTPGEQHASKSMFSPLINENNKIPNADTVLHPGK
jgi:hypothetical protein